jgi:hypothetical protein
MTTAAAIFDDTFYNGPIGKVFILSFLLSFDDVTWKMSSDMFHALIPTAITFKDSATKATGASLWGLALFNPAAVSDIFKAILEGSPVLGVSIAWRKWYRTRARLRLVHSAMMLCEKILSVEVIVDSLVPWNIGVQVGITRANITTIEAQLKVLDWDMSLPLIFGAESDITTVMRKGTDEFALCGFRSFRSGAGRFSSTRLHHPTRMGVRTRNGLKRILPRPWFDDAIRWAAS